MVRKFRLCCVLFKQSYEGWDSDGFISAATQRYEVLHSLPSISPMLLLQLLSRITCDQELLALRWHSLFNMATVGFCGLLILSESDQMMIWQLWVSPCQVLDKCHLIPALHAQIGSLTPLIWECSLCWKPGKLLFTGKLDTVIECMCCWIHQKHVPRATNPNSLLIKGKWRQMVERRINIGKCSNSILLWADPKL